ncbi:MAG: PilZ domain-containing protein [Pseudomonadota bacterium]
MFERRDRSRYRIIRNCVVECKGTDHDGELHEISAVGAFICSRFSPQLGDAVVLHHPNVGAIAAAVVRLEQDGFALAFVSTSDSVLFALSALSQDMSTPPLDYGRVGPAPHAHDRRKSHPEHVS